MKKYYWFIIFLIICFGLILSNPKKQEHKYAVKEKAKKVLAFNEKELENKLQENQNPFAEISGLVGNYFVEKIIDDFIEKNVEVDNYLLFSLTKLRNPENNNVNIIGIGFLGNVIIPQKVVDKFSSEYSKSYNNNMSENSSEEKQLYSETEISNNITIETKKNYENLPKKWVMLSKQDNRLIIFNPCDAINENIVLQRDELKSNLTLLHNCGNDGYYYTIIKIKIKNNVYFIDLETQDETRTKYTYKFENLEDNRGIWTVRNYDNQMKNIITTNADFENNYNIINEPPCLE